VSQALVHAHPGWPAQAARLGARVGAAAGERGRGVAHVGATAVPDLPAPDVLDLLLGVPTPAAADEVRGRLAEAGFVPADAVDPGSGYASADPGRPARLQVRVYDSPEWRDALRLRDWLRADPQARARYLADPHDLETLGAAAALWAASSGWAPSLNGTKPDD
jgi:dephospho-CoA kinase